MQGFILPDITATKKCTLILGSTSNFQLFIIYMYFGQTTQGACLKSVSRTITMQGFILTANTAAKKLTLFLDSP